MVSEHLNNAYSNELTSARDAYEEMAEVVVHEKIMMCGNMPGCRGDKEVQEMLHLESEMSSALRPLAHYYGVLAQCIESGICSARAAFGYLCGDATRIYAGVKVIREHTIDRMKWENLGIDGGMDRNKVKELLEEFRDDSSFALELEKFRLDMERKSRVLENLGAFVFGCRKWNEEHPSRTVKVVDDPFIIHR